VRSLKNFQSFADLCSLGKTIQVIAFVSLVPRGKLIYQLAAIMRKTGRSDDYERRKRTIRSSDKPLSPKYWPTALIVCPKSLLSNVRIMSGSLMNADVQWERELETVCEN
jgi:SNF2 family DNA or RNA helicase